MEFDFEQVLAQSPNPYVLLKPDLTIVWMNEAYLQVTMRERSDIIGRTMFDAFPADPQSESYRLLSGSLSHVIDTEQPDDIAVIRYDITRPDGGTDVRYWSATHTPLKDNGRLAYILQHTVDITEVEELRRMRDEVGIVRRAQAVQRENTTLKLESERLVDFFEQAPGFTAVIAGPDHRFEMVNEAYRVLVGRQDLIGQRVEDAIPEVIDQGFIGVLNQVYESGEPYFGHRELVSLRAGGEAEPVPRYLNFIFQPVSNDGRETTGIIIQGHDVTDEVIAQEHQDILINELNHRVKNTLAIVQGLALQSFRSDTETSDRADFEGRLRTLASAHNLLTEAAWSSASLRDVVLKSVQTSVGGYDERFQLNGPSVIMPPQYAVAMAMIVHELSTNALKYGALSNDTGSVCISWSLDDVDCLRFEWKESGGPPPASDITSGFGTKLVRRGLGGSPDQATELAFEKDGLHYSIECRIAQP